MPVSAIHILEHTQTPTHTKKSVLNQTVYIIYLNSGLINPLNFPIITSNECFEVS